MRTWIDLGAHVVCAAVSLAGLAVVGWVLISGMPAREGMDAMFLLIVGLTFAVFFGMIPMQAIRRREWWKRLARRRGGAEVAHDKRASA